MRNPRPTLSDVAKLSGVTPATVSRVLNKKAQFSVTEAVRDRIVAAAHRLGYAPNLAARSLNTKNTQIIGIFTSPHTHVAEGIYELLLEGIAEVLRASDFDIFIDLSSARGHAVPFWRFDGAILLQSPDQEIVAELDRRGVTYACVNETIGNPIAKILADDRRGMKSAVDHLHQFGHQRIAYANARATYLSHHSVTDRYEALLERTRELKMEVARGHDAPFCSASEFLQESVISERATAIITYDHHIAVALLGAAYTMNIRIPDDLSLICFNDVFPVSLLPPPLTAVGVSGREMGRIGAGLLLNALGGSKTQLPGKEIRVAEELIVRRSTAAPPSSACRDGLATNARVIAPAPPARTDPGRDGN